MARTRLAAATATVMVLAVAAPGHAAAAARNRIVTVSGTVTDGSGHGWPLYATLTVDGVTGASFYTSPFTGHYSIRLPANATYQVHVSANYPGYTAASESVAVGASGVVHDFALPVDAAACTAPGYTAGTTGTAQTFDGTSLPAGWTIENDTPAGGWEFDDPHPRGNLTGGTGGFAIVDSDYLGIGNTEDTYLITPVVDLSAVSSPVLSFDSDYRALDSTADVDYSIDGGATWTNVWHHGNDDARGPSHVEIPLPAAANQAGVRARFHYTGTWAWWWEVDNVLLGSRTCSPAAGGLVAGNVTDANTGTPIDGATVTSVDHPADTATTAATPDDPGLDDGFFWMFSSLTGKHKLTAARVPYAPVTKAVRIGADTTTKARLKLNAGQVTVTPGSITATLPWQSPDPATQTLTFTNTGKAPATVDLFEAGGGLSVLARGGAPLVRIQGRYSPLSDHNRDGSIRQAARTAAAGANPFDAAWASIADYPTTIQDNAAAVVGGKVYSGFGYTGSGDTSALYAYDPGAGSWSALAPAADTREAPAFGAVDGKIYATGGWGSDGNPDAKLEIYDPGSNSWTTGASDPTPFAGSAVAVLGGKLYVVGGCTASSCGVSNVQVYDPSSNSWSTVAGYPEPVAWEACGAITGKLYCAGGTTDSGSIVHSYAYDPGTDSWSPMADLPIDLWASGSTSAEGLLLVSGGVTGNSSTITNQGYALDPSSNTWTALPNSLDTAYRGGSACGFYRIGGNPGGIFSTPLAAAEVLPGNGDCGGDDVPWLAEDRTSFTIPAGGQTTVTVSLDADDPSVTQPGTYSAKLLVDTNTPYHVPAIQVTMNATP